MLIIINAMIIIIVVVVVVVVVEVVPPRAGLPAFGGKDYLRSVRGYSRKLTSLWSNLLGSFLYLKDVTQKKIPIESNPQRRRILVHKRNG